MDDFSDMFSSFNGSSFGGSDVPSINDIKADYTSADNIISGDAKSEDWGRGVGAAVGTYFGAPQLGANIGAKAFPIIGDAISGVWDAISK